MGFGKRTGGYKSVTKKKFMDRHNKCKVRKTTKNGKTKHFLFDKRLNP